MKLENLRYVWIINSSEFTFSVLYYIYFTPYETSLHVFLMVLSVARVKFKKILNIFSIVIAIFISMAAAMPSVFSHSYTTKIISPRCLHS